MSHRPPPSTGPGIAHYRLYGQPDDSHAPDFLHVEAMAARAQQLTRNIKPHVHRDMFQLAFAATGHCLLSLDRHTQLVDGPCVVGIPSSVVHGFEFDEQGRGWVLTLADQLLTDRHRGQEAQLFEPLLQAPFVLRLHTAPQEAEQLAWTFAHLLDEFQGNALGRGSSIDSLVRLLMIQLRRQLDQQAQEPDAPDPTRALYARFRAMVERRYRAHWTVAAYAQELGCSQARLNRVCSLMTGRKANEVLLDRLGLEAQRHLIYTGAPVSSIAYDLGFSDPAYFSRFFKRHTGQAPGAWRSAQQRTTTG